MVDMDQNKKLFSILVICYNHEKYIDDAIKSVLEQTYDNIELIICDDYSKDNSWKIIQTYLPELNRKFSRVVAFQNTENLGLIKSLNKMILESKGEIIFNLSGDDMMLKDYAWDVINTSMKYPNASVFASDGFFVEEESKYSDIDITKLTSFYIEKPDLCKETLFERMYWSNRLYATGVSLKRELFNKFGFYDANIFIEDWEYWLRISLTGETEFVYIDKKNVLYRKNPNSVSSTEKNEEFIERRLSFLNESEKILEKYATNVEISIYANRKWKLLLDKWEFYKINVPKDKKKFMKNELSPFVKKYGRLLGMRKIITYLHFCCISYLFE